MADHIGFKGKWLMSVLRVYMGRDPQLTSDTIKVWGDTVSRTNSKSAAIRD